MGGAALHLGNIAEMKTGEGKTLVATLPAYLNALTGKGVHVVTVNDYLAKRTSEQMGRVHRFLGLEVGVILAQMTPEQRRAPPTPPTSPTAPTTSSASTTCATTWRWSVDEMVQRGHNFAIVDEVDSILIDEARTPLIISARPTNAEVVLEFAKIVRRLKPDEDYEVDEKKRTVGVLEPASRRSRTGSASRTCTSP
jgi:preprotein translocase subunit SecA